jgi:hypothetical protein
MVNECKYGENTNYSYLIHYKVQVKSSEPQCVQTEPEFLNI